MSTYNYFGATTAGVVDNFTVGDYTPTVAEFGGTAVVQSALASATWEVEQALPPIVFQQLTEPDLQLVERRATAGQTTVTLGFIPVIAGKVHIWVGQPGVFIQRPSLATDGWAINNGMSQGQPVSYLAQSELDSARFSVNATTGVVTLTTALTANDYVFASYQVDVDAAAYSVPSLANIIESGAAAEVGSKVYPRAGSSWELVQTYADQYARAIEALNKGNWVPSELRLMRWFQEVEKAQDNRISSTRLYRA